MLIFINKQIFIFVLLCYDYLNTATNHQPYWGDTAPLLGGGGTAPCAPPLVTALIRLRF